MQFLKPLVLTIFLLLFSSPAFGQEVASKGDAEATQEPSIVGGWTEPVNGVRMMAKFLQSGLPSEQIQILVFLQNCSQQEVEVPPLNSERFLFFKNSEMKTNVGSNLRIVAEALDGQELAVVRMLKNFRDSGMRRLEAALKPGEIRLHGISIRCTPATKQVELMNQDAVRSDTVFAEALSDPKSKGRWRFSLSYRPDGQFPESDESVEELHKQKVAEQWKGVQIDLSPLELDWHPPSAEISDR